MTAIPTKVRIVDGATEVQVAGYGLNYASSIFTRSIDLGFPEHREFLQPQSGADGEYDLTRYMGGRTIQLSILVMDDAVGGRSRHQIADTFRSMCLAYKRLQMYVTFEGMSEYKMTVRGISAGYSIEKTSGAYLLVGMTFYCAQGVMESADMYATTVSVQSTGSPLTFYDADGDRRGTDMGVTNASTTVTSATAAFVAGDVGKQLYIVTVPYQIAGYTNSTTVTLTMAYAGTTGSGKAWQFTPGIKATNTGFTFASGGYGNALITNSEEIPTPPLIRVYGPITDPEVEVTQEDLVTGDQTTATLYFPGLTITAGYYLEIDSANRSATSTDPAFPLPMNYMDITSSWWYLNPGANYVTLTGSSTTSQTQAIVYYRTRKV